MNLFHLIDLTRDPNRANHDRAVLLLSQVGGDTSAVRAALLEAASEEDDVVRAEAVSDLASRNLEAALPLVRAA